MPESTKRTRRKATTPLGRNILQRERQRLAKEQALVGEQMVEQARQRMLAESKLRHKVTPEDIAFNKGLVQRVSAVLASERVNLPIHTRPTDGDFKAWTDFDQINVTYHLHDDVRLTAAILRGMLYHEGGHVRFTLPFPTLVDLAEEEFKAIQGNEHAELPTHAGGRSAVQRAWNSLEDQRMETAVVSDSPRKAVYFTPMILTELMKDPNHAKANWPLLVWRRYIPKHLREKARSYWITEHGADKALEVEDCVTRYVTTESPLEMWLCAVEMAELMRQAPPLTIFSEHHNTGYTHDDEAEKENASNKLQIPIDPSMLDEETLKDIIERMEEQLRQQAQQPAPSPSEGVDEVDDADDVDDEEEGEESDESGGHGGEEYDADEDADDEWLPDEPEVEYVLPIQIETPGTSDEQAEGDTPVSGEDADASPDSQGDHGPGDDAEGEDDDALDDEDADGGEAAGSHGSNDTETSSDPSKGIGGGTHDSDTFDEEAFKQSFQDDLEESIEEAETERYEDKALDGDVEAFETAKWDTDSNLLPYNPGQETDGVLVAVADNLAYEIEQTFQASTIDRAPAWVEQQRRGVVNVLRYETRQPGDAEFYRAWVDDDQPGYDIAVSILLDYSGSMGGLTGELAQAGYASKLACDRLGIPCTVVLWDTDAKTLWDASDRVQEMPRIDTAGGTNPEVALADLENQRMEKEKHLVLIFTDGQWQDWGGKNARSLTSYKDAGRYFISFVLNEAGMAETLKRYGSDEAYDIEDLMEIPRRLEVALIEHS